MHIVGNQGLMPNCYGGASLAQNSASGLSIDGKFTNDAYEDLNIENIGSDSA